MELSGLAVGVLVGIGAGVVVALVATGRMRAAMAAERATTVQALAQQFAVEREKSTRATVDTVLAVAGDKLGAQAERAEHHYDLKGQAFDEKVAGLHTELRRVSTLVGDLQRDKAEQHGQFVTGLDQAIRASAALNDTTQALREALSNSRARGQ